MRLAAGVNGSSARRAGGVASKIAAHAQDPAADTAEDGALSALGQWPDLRGVIRQRRVAFEAREPGATALHPQRDHIHGPLSVGAPRLRVDIDTLHCVTVDLAELWGSLTGHLEQPSPACQLPGPATEVTCAGYSNLVFKNNDHTASWRCNTLSAP